VDSAVSAGLLAEQGRPLVGVFMRNGVAGSGEGNKRSCCSVSDARDARRVADHLDIPFYVQDLSKPFAELIDSFCRDYVAGRTPNPCVLCNNDLKFGELIDLADDLSCDGVATGHYARLEDGQLLRAADRTKDQSYLLHGLRPEQLRRARFPIGHLDKSTVRDEARRLGLPVADKPDSADICFVPGGDYRAVVRERLGGLGPAGEIADRDGKAVAMHDGVGGFTVGQRRGLGVALGEPVFVTDIDSHTGRVSVGRRDDLKVASCRVGGVMWHDPEAPHRGPLLVQLRHHHNAEPATVKPRTPDSSEVDVHFDRPSHDVTPGQYAVFYDGDRVVGGGRILHRDGQPSVHEPEQAR
jgi:tRNA-specific 2-thiouridylase